MTTPPRPAPTSRDVARLARVSQAAVSYAFTGRGTLSAATRAHVLQVAESIGYRPNRAARSVRTGRPGRLAVVTATTGPHGRQVLAGAGQAAEQAGYAVEAHAVDGTVDERTRHVLGLAADGRYEGILALAPVHAHVHRADGTAVPVVAEPVFDPRLHSAGALADASPLDTLVDTLVAHGLRRFVHLAGPDDYLSARARRARYLAAVARHPVTSWGVVEVGWSAHAARRAVLDLLDDAAVADAHGPRRTVPGAGPEGPLVVVAANDAVAAGTVRAAHERGLRVPHDLLVTGWDNTELGAVMVPSLTTVEVDLHGAGRAAMAVLLATVRGEPDPRPPQVRHTVIWRESTGTAGRSPDDAALRRRTP